MPVTPFQLTGLASANLWLLQSNILVLPDSFDPSFYPTLWLPNTSYMVIEATFNTDPDAEGNPGTGSLVVQDDLTVVQCYQGGGAPTAVGHPPPDPTSVALVTNAANAASITGGLTFSFGGVSFGPIGMFESIDAAKSGIVAQGAAPGQVFWLLQTTMTMAAIWSSTDEGSDLVQQSPLPPQLQFPMTSVITIPVQ